MTDLVDKAMLKYPTARRIAVDNFSSGYSSLSYECLANLAQDTRCYKWNTATVNAIKWVITQKAKAKSN